MIYDDLPNLKVVILDGKHGGFSASLHRGLEQRSRASVHRFSAMVVLIKKHILETCYRYYYYHCYYDYYL